MSKLFACTAKNLFVKSNILTKPTHSSNTDKWVFGSGNLDWNKVSDAFKSENKNSSLHLN